ncbi:MAG: NAD(P)-dependent alcohol dehydrogenase [Vicingaceae bacterium]
MKAIYCSQYGAPEELDLREVEKLKPKGEQVLVKIKATAINDYDWSMVRGKPILYRLLFGLKKPKNPIPGMECSGVVEEVGSAVSTFKKGDFVFGDTSNYEFGTFAEYCCLNQKALNLKPDFLSHEEAAAIPHAGLLAWQSFFELGKLKKGEKVLINGGGGGVGALAVQIAKAMNCEVHGVDTGEKLSLMKSWGFDQVFDYKNTDFTRNNLQYDFILDCKSNRFASAYKKVLTQKGRYISVGGKLFKLMCLALVGKFSSKKRFYVLSLKSNQDLDTLLAFMQKHQIKPIIEGPFQLKDTPKQISRFGAGKHFGKIMICP